ncbi:MAG: helix-turn-helix domain-containing protein [Planctomycetes bacterium]|nr:helix-turn-helix domain-containing protein [Planctomycetota bacterium]
MKARSPHPQYLTIGGKRVVVLEEDDYQRLAQQADVWEPPMPERDADGNYPALEAMAVSLARDILRSRRRLGLSQAELARRAKISRQALDRIERATSKPNTKVIDRIERVLNPVSRQTNR